MLFLRFIDEKYIINVIKFFDIVTLKHLKIIINIS